ncbi:DUF29 domain-containing protein [Rhodopila sp.]|uniref:DUF29 domain-containing protein n=1 Tax=Rhodopila sp. TaxID=2480087 RepID=UPI003D0EB602
MSNLYETDVVAWSERQAELLRRVAAGETINDQVDWPNIIDEVETVGRSERAALRSHIAVVLEHLIKLQASPATEPRSGWKASIDRARNGIFKVLKDNPSLRPAVAGLIADETPDVRTLVVKLLNRYGEQPGLDTDSLTFTQEQVLDDWFP